MADETVYIDEPGGTTLFLRPGKKPLRLFGEAAERLKATSYEASDEHPLLPPGAADEQKAAEDRFNQRAYEQAQRDEEWNRRPSEAEMVAAEARYDNRLRATEATDAENLRRLQTKVGQAEVIPPRMGTTTVERPGRDTVADQAIRGAQRVDADASKGAERIKQSLKDEIARLRNRLSDVESVAMRAKEQKR